jgi:hypothetical protein
VPIQGCRVSGVVIRGAGKRNRSLGIDHPGRVGLIFLDGLVSIFDGHHLIIV